MIVLDASAMVEALVGADPAPVADRHWQLRHQLTSYAACYLALAEALEVPLVTCDRKLDTSGHRAQVVIFSRTS